ncbi:MAG: hypothetical protein ACI3V3_04250 [Faecousia sp.]
MDLEHEQRLSAVESRAKSNTHRLDEVERRQDNLDKLVTSVEVLATRQETVEADVKEIKSDVKQLADKPGRRWDQLVDKAILVVVTAIITFLLSRLGVA